MKRASIRASRLWALAGVASVLVIWQVLSVAGVLREPFIPSVQTLATALPAELSTAELWHAAGYTVVMWLVGLAAACVLGIGVGVLLGTSRILNSLVSPIVEVLRPIPFIAILPLAAVALGLTTSMEFWMVVYAAAWPIIIQTSNGMRTIPPIVTDTASTYLISGQRALFNVYLPAISPYILTGIKFAASLSLIVAVTVELIAGTPGLGYRVLIAQHSANYGQMYLDIMFSGLIGYAGYVVTSQFERWNLRWHPKFREGANAKA